jgi:glycosyltransferase involved in cell wall biosynthesis
MNNAQQPAVSVIIPVYNGTNYLGEAIESVLAQTFTDYELIVIDDGSTDRTWNIIQSYGQLLRGVQKSNGGVASALNRGLKEMHGRWFAWLSHDDLWLPTKLEYQVNFLLKSPQFKACYTDYFIIDSQGVILKEVETPWYPRQQAARIMFGQMYMGGSTMLIERACFERAGWFSETLRTTQDVDMWMRLLRYFEIGRIPEKLAKERTHPGQDSRKVAIHDQEKAETYSRIFEEWGVAELFPEWPASADQAQTSAKAHTWFGDTMANDRKYYALANLYYIRAIKIYPSWRNPAWTKWLVNQVRRFIHSITIKFVVPLVKRLRGKR